MALTTSRIVIARFSVWKAAFISSPLLLAAYAVLRYVLFNENGPTYYFVSRPQWMPFVAIVLIATFAYLIYFAALVYQIVFRSRAAMWVEVGTERLVYMHKLVRSVLLRDVTKVSVGTTRAYGFTFRALVFEKKGDGGIYTIATAVFAEKPDSIVARLYGGGWIKA